MRIVGIGAGPANRSTSAILMKKAYPEVDIHALRAATRADDTFGWGVVFSDETLGHFDESRPGDLRGDHAQFAYWTDIETYYGDTCACARPATASAACPARSCSRSSRIAAPSSGSR